MTLKDVTVLVVSDGYWGKGDTVEEALDKIRSVGGRRPRRYQVYLAHSSVWLDGLNFCWTTPDGDDHCDWSPRLVAEVGIKKKGAKR